MKPEDDHFHDYGDAPYEEMRAGRAECVDADCPDKQPPNPYPGDRKFSRCESCDRVLVTVEGLAVAIHSGCALTGEKHDLSVCPSRYTFMLDAKGIYGYIERRAPSPKAGDT